MPSNVVARRRTTQGRITRYMPAARAGMSLVRKGYNAWKGRQSGTKGNTSKGRDDTAPLYGSTFTSKVSYRSKKPRRRRVSRAKRSFGSFLRNSMKLQNAQNGLASNTFNVSNPVSGQGWGSIDVMNSGSVFNFVIGQLPAGTTNAQLRDFTLYLKTFSLRWYMTNSGTNPVFIDLYHVIPRRDVTFAEAGAPATPSNGGIVAGMLAGTSQFDQLPDVKGDATIPYGTVGASPFLYPGFTRVFKITKIRTLKMAPGETYEERDTILNRRVNLTAFGALQGGSTIGNFNLFYKRGMSKSILFRVRGAPGIVSSNPVTALPATITCGWEEQSTCKVMQTRPSSQAMYLGEG